MNKEKINKKIDEIINDYKINKNFYINYCNLIENLCKQILEDNKINNYFIHSRIKNIDSLKEKLIRAGKKKAIIEQILDNKVTKYNSWQDICDLCAVRIVFAFERDLKQFLLILRSQFKDCILEEQIEEKDDGYESIHIIIKFSDDRLKLPEYSHYKNILCELQIRTVLDHAWAESSHKIYYKPDTIFTKYAPSKTKDYIKNELKKIRLELINPAKERLNGVYNLYLSRTNDIQVTQESQSSGFFNLSSNREILTKISKLNEALTNAGYAINSFPLENITINIIKNVEHNDPKNTDYNIKKLIYLECLRLVEILKNIDFSIIVNILHMFKVLNDKKIDEKILDIYRDRFKYDYFLLNKYGLYFQKQGLEYIKNQINVLDISDLKVILTTLLNPSFSGTKMSDENTVSLISGTLQVDSNLIAIRKDAINIVLENIRSQKSLENKLLFIQILDNASRFPQTSKYGKDFEEMIGDNAKYIVKQYNQIIFAKNNKIKISLSLVREIEAQLIRIINRPIKKAKSNAQKLIDKLNQNETYCISRILATNIRNITHKKDWEELQKERKKEVDEILKKITEKDITKYTDILDEIGKDLDRNNSWTWRSYSDLLCKIAEKKPEIMDTILENSSIIKNKFLIEVLEGYRKSKKWKLLDKYIQYAIKTKDKYIIGQVFWSLHLTDKNNIKNLVRNEDVGLLNRAVENKLQLKKNHTNNNDNITWHNSIIWALIAIYHFDPKQIEKTIYTELKSNPKLNTMLLKSINVGIIRNQINFKGWSKKTINLIIKHLIEVDDIDHDLQGILFNLSKNDIDIFWGVIKARIEKSLKRKSKKNKFYNKYEAIPYYIDDDLRKILSTDKKRTKDYINKLVDEMINKKTLLFNWLLTDLMDKIGGSFKKEIIDELAQNKNEEKLEAATSLMGSFNKPNVDLCMKIISNSSGSKSKVWDSVVSRMYTTGIVTGEYGFRDHYKNLLEQIQKEQKKYKNDKNIQRFVYEITESLKKSIKGEEKRVKERKLIRKMEFEG